MKTQINRGPALWASLPFLALLFVAFPLLALFAVIAVAVVVPLLVYERASTARRVIRDHPHFAQHLAREGNRRQRRRVQRTFRDWL